MAIAYHRVAFAADDIFAIIQRMLRYRQTAQSVACVVEIALSENFSVYVRVSLYNSLKELLIIHRCCR